MGCEKIYFTHINHETSDREILERYRGRAESAHDMLRLEVEDS